MLPSFAQQIVQSLIEADPVAEGRAKSMLAGLLTGYAAATGAYAKQPVDSQPSASEQTLNAEKQPGDQEWWISGTGSMYPAIPRYKHRILVRKIPFDQLKKGMIVARSSHKNNSSICHRLFKKVSEGEWWARGDNNPMPDDEYVTPKNYVGVIVAQDTSQVDPADLRDKGPEWVRNRNNSVIRH